MPARFFLACLLALSLLAGCQCYHLGGDEPMCWVTDLSTNVQVLLDNCPSTLTASWVVPPPDEFSSAKTPPTVTWRVVATMENICNRSGFVLPTPATPHSNLHSCVSSLVPFCTPSVHATPGLNTQTPSQAGPLSASGVVEFSSQLLMAVLNDTHRTTWTVLAHTRVYSRPNSSSSTILAWDVAIGKPTTVFNVPTFDGRSEAMQIALFVVAGLLIALVVATSVVMLFYRSHVIITASSPVFLHLMCLFAIVGLGAVYSYGVSPQNDASCVVSIWLAGIGFTGLFGCLLSKTFRLWRLFRSKDFRPVIITNLQVFGFVLLIIAPEAIIFIIWTAVDPPQPTRIYNADISYTVECQSDVNSLWIALISTYQLLILFCGLVLSFLTRKFTTLFRESKFISYATIIMLAAAILAPVQFTEGSSPDAIFILQALQVLLYGPVVFIIVWPKLFRIWRGDNPSLSNLAPTSVNSGSSLSHLSATSGSQNDDREKQPEALFKNGVLRGTVAHRIRDLANSAHQLGTMIDAADPITPDQMTDFVQHFNSLKRYI